MVHPVLMSWWRVHPTFLRSSYDDKDAHQDKVEYEHANTAPEVHNIPSTDTLAEEYTVVIEAVDAEITLIAMLHVARAIDVTFHAVEHLFLVSVLVDTSL